MNVVKHFIVVLVDVTVAFRTIVRHGFSKLQITRNIG